MHASCTLILSQCLPPLNSYPTMSSGWLEAYLSRTGIDKLEGSPPHIDIDDLPEWHDPPVDIGAASDDSEATLDSLYERNTNLPTVYNPHPQCASPRRPIPCISVDIHRSFKTHYEVLEHLNQLAIPCGSSVLTGKQSYVSRGFLEFICLKGFNSGKQTQQSLGVTSKTGCTWKIGCKL